MANRHENLLRIMAAAGREQTGREFIASARQLGNSGCYSKAFDMYLSAFDKNSSLKARFEGEFRCLLNRLNEVLANTGKIQDIFLNFTQAVNIFPDSIYLLNETGKYLYKYGCYEEAWWHFEKVLKMDSGFVNAEKNLNSVKNLLVERWHFRMLNDKIRNEAYRVAIKETLKPVKDTVLDLGSGTGLLSLYAMDGRPITITAVDGSEQMVQIAEYVFHHNFLYEAAIINRMSTEMDSSDIGGKVSVLVTEMFDAGLFGEHILQSLAHAHKNFMLEGGVIIPNKGEFLIVGAECDNLHKNYQLSADTKTFLNIPNLNVHLIMDDETYDCEDVYRFQGLKYITEPKSLLKIDFNDYDDIQEKLTRIDRYSIELTAVENGNVNVIIGYFRLYLTDNIIISTDPTIDNRASAWQQAVFFDHIPKPLMKDENINMDFLLDSGKLTLVPNDSITRVSHNIVRFLNDTEYVNMIKKCLGMASVYLGQTTEMSQIRIVDLCPFPLFGFLMLKRGAGSVTCCAKTPEDENFLRKVLEENNLPWDRINLLVGDDWDHETFKKEKYHAVFCNILDICGDTDIKMHEISQYLKNGHLLPGGLYMPNSIQLVGQVVQSEWLDLNNRVYDRNTSHFKIGEFINKFQTSENYHIDFSCLEYTALTEPTILGKYGNVVSGVVNADVIKTGKANAVLCWYKVELLENLGEITTNRSNCFIDGLVFLVNPPLSVNRQDVVDIIRCVDIDGAFKLMLDLSDE